MNEDIIQGEFKDWKLKEKEKFDAPIIAEMHFENGISMATQFNRLILNDKSTDQSNSHIVEIAKRLLKTYQINPNFKLDALGINFVGIFKNRKPDTLIKEKFISPLPLPQKADIKTGELKISYEYKGCDFNIHILADGENEYKIPGLLTKANYHIDLSNNNNTNKSLGFIDSFQEKLEYFKTNFHALIE